MQRDDPWGVINVVNLYAAALDARRYDLFDQVFAEDARCDFGGGAAWEDRASLKAAFDPIHAGFAATQHIVSGHVVRIEGDAALCFSYVNARFVRIIDGARAVFDSTGWYDDRLSWTPDGWRIADRTSRMVTAGGDLKVMAAMPDVEPDFALMALYEEAAAGRVAFFQKV